MAKNEFLPFGTAANANVLPNADYQALPARSAGFNSGVAKSEELNTVWRQASVMSSALGQFMADNTGNDVLDNGDVPALVSQLSGAISLFSASTGLLANDGYIAIPVNISGVKRELIIQWGIINGTGSTSVTKNFPIKFPVDLLQSVATLRDMSGGDTSGVSIYANWIPDNEARRSTVRVGVSGVSIGEWTAKYLAVGI